VINEVSIEDTATAAEIGAVADCFSTVGYGFRRGKTAEVASATDIPTAR
jgi:hypothetical protein